MQSITCFLKEIFPSNQYYLSIVGFYFYHCLPCHFLVHIKEILLVNDNICFTLHVQFKKEDQLFFSQGSLFMSVIIFFWCLLMSTLFKSTLSHYFHYPIIPSLFHFFLTILSLILLINFGMTLIP